MKKISLKCFKFRATLVESDWLFVSLRFSIDSSSDAVIFSCPERTAVEINRKPHTFLGKKRYKLCNFVDLVQCFRCSKFGHKTAKCVARKTCCPNCAQNHPLDECQTNHTPHCGNCLKVGAPHSAHSSWDVRCPFHKKSDSASLTVDKNGQQF